MEDLFALSQAATLLDAFVLNKDARCDTKHSAPIDWGQRFLEQSALTLQENTMLSDVVEIVKNKDGGLTVAPKPGVTTEALTARLHECGDEYERRAEAELDFPRLYGDLLELSVAAIQDIFTETESASAGTGLPFDPAQLGQVYTTKSVPFCEPWSAQFDLSFESGGDKGRAIACPDPRRLTGPSREAWARMVTTPGAFYRPWVERAYHALPHELFHCVQSFTKGFCDSGKWFSEFGATAVSVNLLHYMARSHEFREAHPKAKSLLPQGSLEALMVDLEREASHLREAFRGTEWVETLYARWAGSFGREAPERLTSVEGASYYAKNRIALDAPYIGSVEKSEYRDLMLKCLDSHK